ncbi:uncharacterized protein simc1 isoform X2 [Festucalex cinctus]
MNGVIAISSDSDSDENGSDVEFVQVIHPPVLIGERQSTKAHRDGKLHERKTDCNANSLMKKAKQEKNIPKIALTHNTSNGLDLHIHKSSTPNCAKFKPNLEVLAFQFKPIQNYRIPKKRSLLETRVREGTRSACVDLNKDATHRSVYPRKPHNTHGGKTDESSSSVHVPSSFTPTSSYTNNIQKDPISTSNHTQHWTSLLEDVSDEESDMSGHPRPTCDHGQDGTTISQRGTEDVTVTESNNIQEDPISTSNHAEDWMTLLEDVSDEELDISGHPRPTCDHTRDGTTIARRGTEDVTDTGQEDPISTSDHAEDWMTLLEDVSDEELDMSGHPRPTCDHTQDGTTVSRRGTEDVTDAGSKRSDDLSRSIPVDSPKSVSKIEGLLTGGNEAERDRLKDSHRNAAVEIRGGKQEENVPKRTLKHDASNELDLHTHKSSKQDCGKVKPNFDVLSSQLNPTLSCQIPKKRPFLEAEDTHSGQNASLGVTEDATQRSRCPGQLHDTHADNMDGASSSLTNNSQENPISTCDRAQACTTVLEVVTDEESDRSDQPSQNIAIDSPPSVLRSEQDLDWSSGDEVLLESPTYFMWQEGESDGEGNADVKSSQDESRFVCPQAYQRIMDGLANTMTHEENGNCEIAAVQCQQRLSLVHITMEENHHEATLQLLSDLLRPGYCLPKDVASHLLSGILLDPLCPPHLCVQTSNLLMRAQRHHLVDKDTVPWSWEMLTAVMSTQDEKKKHRPEVVRMFLEYVAQTLEDDFFHKKSTSELYHSIARATLSCNQRFPQVQGVIKWLFSAIIKSTESEKSSEAARERDEHIRIVSSLQRMLTLALEVDRSPTLSAPKLSRELFSTLISIEPLRAHRQLLLDSLQSNLLRGKLLESLLDYASPLKSAVPMSLSHLLYFLENCTLAADPTDDGDRWKKWEELVQHLWMLLVSYNTTMKGSLSSSVSEQISRPDSVVYKSNDVLTKADVSKSVDVFLTRSKADVGQALPLHVDESLTFLQNFLLDLCQS